MFEQTFKNIDDILHKDAGCGSELDYVEQTSWVLFLKYLDDLEKDKATAAELTGKTYTNIIDKEYQWSVWAAPKKSKAGSVSEVEPDHHKALTGDDLSDFVNGKLFPYLKKFKADAESADTIEYKIGEIFSELKNRIQSGYNLREVINRIDELRFRTHAEKHEMSHLYEDKIKNMGNAGRNGGEYYTPRPLIKTIVKVVAPKVGNKIYDGAVGSAGFLVEAYDYLRSTKNLTTKDVETLQKKTFYGKEKKSLAYIIGTMNMILHGVEAPNIVHTNTLAENLADILEKLDEAGFGKEELTTLQKLIDAEKSDLFDVLEYVFNSDIKPMTREARVAAAQATIFALLNDKQKEFIAFVLSKYIEIGVEELDQEKLPILLTNKYQSLEDAKEILGDVANISRLFIEFQQHLYKQKAA
jgi:type I restriction-modification system DNA methylase subunit